MNSKANNIKEYWQGRADDNVDEGQITHPDIWQRWLEIQLIRKYVSPNDEVIDIGCGNGYTIKHIAPFVKSIKGIDYSSKMIGLAKENFSRDSNPEYSNIEFDVKDVLELSQEDGVYDIAISERCLINLKSWEDQRMALDNITTVIRPDGKLILCEGSYDGREGLNKFRKKLNLDRMPEVWHNIDFKNEQIISYLKKNYVLEVEHSFGIYDLISRVVHPLLADPEQPRYDSKINEIAAHIALNRNGFNDISRVLFLVLRKK